ncbi:MAG: hypothetical protein ABL879_16955 [Devosia sp.]
MEVFELYDISVWYRAYFKNLRRLYTELHNALSNNANNPTKIAIEEPLSNVVSFLSEMAIGELSLQQLDLLDDLGVRQLVGSEGARWIEAVVKAEAYDPVTTEQSAAAALASINSANDRLTAYASAIDQMELERPNLAEEIAGRVTVRVGFRNDVSIRNVKDWKSSADDWYQIVRGLALMSGEAPEETKVVGASTGSIILVLSATYAVSKLLATIAKHITGTAKQILELQITREELRQKKILTKTMEAEFIRLQEEARANAKDAITKEVKGALPKSPNGEQTTALDKSIQKLLEFGEKGGDVDFVAPPEPAPDEVEDQKQSPAAQIRSVRNLILAYQEEREVVRLLTSTTAKKAGENTE